MTTRLQIRNAIFLALVSMLALLASPGAATAVPANPSLRILEQPDGSSFTASQWGDEAVHGWETKRGSSIVFDKELNAWTYARLGRNKQLVSSSRIVGKDSPPRGLQRHLRPEVKLPSGAYKLTREDPRFWEGKRKQGKSGPWKKGLGPQIAPATGTNYLPIILVNFSPGQATYGPPDFLESLFTGQDSLADYYEEVSYGDFSVAPGPGGIAGWYYAIYSHDYYGANDGSGNDLRPGDLVREAVSFVDYSYDFAPYDQDGDCYVDVVNIIHQGTDEASGGVTTDIWSHRWNLESANTAGASSAGEYTTDDNCPAGGKIKVNDYLIVNEVNENGQQETIGVFAHEYGHALGLPDLYDTDNSPALGIGYWSLMASGNYNWVDVSGDSPAHPDAWSKYKLGWVAPLPLVVALSNVTISQAATTADVYRIRAGTPTSGEYFLIENRQKAGFDSGIPGSGLLVWHIDGPALLSDMSPNDSECFPGGFAPCTPANHYAVRLVQADNRWDLEKGQNRGDGGDPFPGTTGRTSFNYTGALNSNLYNGTGSNAALFGIGASGPNMVASMSALAPAAPSRLSTVATSPSRIILSWKDHGPLEDGFRIDRKTGTCSSGSTWRQAKGTEKNVTTWTDTGRTANTNYSYRIRAWNQSSPSSYTSCSSAVTGRAGTPGSPNELTATSTGLTRVRLTWNDASNNESTFRVYRKVRDSGTWTRVANLRAGTESWTDSSASGNTTNTTHHYKVQACNAPGCSPSTNVATVTFAPSQPGLSRATARQITVRWSDRSANETGFHIYRKNGSCGSANSWGRRASVTTNTTSWTDSSLSTGNRYAYKVRAATKSWPHPFANGLSSFTSCVSTTVP